MLTRILFVPLTGLLLVAPLPAQSVPHDSLLDHLTGHWVLRGPMAGQNVVHDVTFQWVLGGEYLEMHEVAQGPAKPGSPPYEAIVYFVRDPRTHQYAGLWMDNTGYNAFDPAGVGHAMAAGDSIPFVFTDSPTSHFYNTFVYNRTANSWAWHMDNSDAKGRQPFARVTLTRR